MEAPLSNANTSIVYNRISRLGVLTFYPPDKCNKHHSDFFAPRPRQILLQIIANHVITIGESRAAPIFSVCLRSGRQKVTYLLF